MLSIFRGICEAVQCMHSTKPQPLAHRDIKTANVLLKEDLTPLLMDLGMCNVLNNLQCFTFIIN